MNAAERKEKGWQCNCHPNIVWFPRSAWKPPALLDALRQPGDAERCNECVPTQSVGTR